MHKIVVYTLRLLPEAKILPASFAVCKGANNNTHLFKAKYWGSETQPLLRLQKEKKKANKAHNYRSCLQKACCTSVSK